MRMLCLPGWTDLMNGARTVVFATSNDHKLAEASAVLGPLGFTVERVDVELLEIQETSLEKIARFKLGHAPPTKSPLFAEDTGLFVQGLKNFPGPYAAFVFKTLSYPGILKLMEGLEDRTAYFESVIAYRDLEGEVHSFVGRADGWIAQQASGTQWGFDPIFVPDHPELNPDHQTFAVMGAEVKNQISHRARALAALRDYLVDHY